MNKWIERLLLDNIDMVTVQEPKLTPENVVEMIRAEIQLGVTTLVGNPKKKILFIVRRINEYILDIHMVSECKDGFALVKEGRKGMRWIWRNTNKQRVEMRTHQKGVMKYAERVGWELEGVRKGSFRTEDGTFIDEYEYGMSRPEEYNSE